jgi:hypothetical protein
MKTEVGDSRHGITPLASLRRYVPSRAVPKEHCGLCEAVIAPEHSHLIEPATRRLVCACEPCAILFDGREGTKYRRVPRGSRLLTQFVLTDELWEGLNLPINLAFFVKCTATGGVVAMYPSPAGATESLVAAEAWDALVERNPSLANFRPDVEALLVNRVSGARDCYRVGVDECFKLVGVIRSYWRGLSGGSLAWAEIDQYFQALKERSTYA